MQLLWPILFSLADAILDEYAKTSFGLDDGLHLYLPRSMIFKLSFPLFQLYAKRSRVSQAWSTLSSKWLDALKDREFLIQRRVLNWTDDDTDQQPSTVVLPADSSETDSTDGQ